MYCLTDDYSKRSEVFFHNFGKVISHTYMTEFRGVNEVITTVISLPVDLGGIEEEEIIIFFFQFVDESLYHICDCRYTHFVLIEFALFLAENKCERI